MIYRAIHSTRYVYAEQVSQCLSEVRLTPRSFPGQRVLESRITVSPETASRESRTDYFGNQAVTLWVLRPHSELTVRAESVVEVRRAGSGFTGGPAWEDVVRMLDAPPDAECLAASEFVFDSPYAPRAPALAAFALPVFWAGRPLSEAARALSHLIHTGFRYAPKSTTIDMPLLDVLEQRAGVCQDFAHVMTGALRSLGLAARYVSGYLRSGRDYLGAEASHAWVSVFVPGQGWMDLDPTNDMEPGDGHVTLAWGRDYGDVAPVKGVTLGGGSQTVSVEVSVRPAPDVDW